jgi:hypothetical protein
MKKIYAALKPLNIRNNKGGICIYMISEYYNLIWSIAILIICGVLMYSILVVIHDIGYYVIYKVLYPIYSFVKNKLLEIVGK